MNNTPKDVSHRTNEITARISVSCGSVFFAVTSKSNPVRARYANKPQKAVTIVQDIAKSKRIMKGIHFFIGVLFYRPFCPIDVIVFHHVVSALHSWPQGL